MLANLIATIMMALGVATGNVSSNVYKGGNAFYDAEQKTSKPIQKAVEEIDESIQYKNVSSYQTTPDDRTYYLTKYFLQNDNSDPNYYTNYFLLRNTTYVGDVSTNTSRYYDESNVWQVNEITNYFDSVLNITLINTTFAQLNQEFNIDINMYISRDSQISNYIDLTLNANVWPTLNTLITNLENNTIESTKLTDIDTSHTNTQYTNYDIQYSSGSILLAPRETIYVVAYQNVRNNTTINGIMGTNPSLCRIRGSVNVPTNNYEIVDIPNVMYTILTMPFSFISTAFNLTVFPGTPYALNFGNLFLTIIAVFILLWLIKKVFH